MSDAPRAAELRVTSAHPVSPAAALDLAALERMAMQANPTLAIALGRIDAARGRAIQAGIYPDPSEFVYDPDEVGAAGTPGAQGGFIEQRIVTGGKLRINRERYEQEADLARWQAEAQRLRVLNGVRIRFFEVLALRRLVDVRGELLRLNEEVARAVEASAREGSADRADVLTASNAIRRARIDLADAQARHRAAWAGLASLVGSPDLPSTPLLGDLEPVVPPPDREAMLALLLRDSPELRAAHSEIARDRLTLQREQVERIPDLAVRLGAQYDHTTNEALPITRLYVFLPLWDRNQGNIRTAQAGLANAHRQFARVSLDLQERLAGAFARYDASRAVAEEARHLVPTSREIFELRFRALREGEGKYLDVRSALQDYAAAGVDSVEALLAMRRADIEIRGFLLTDGLDDPPGPATGDRPNRMVGP